MVEDEGKMFDKRNGRQRDCSDNQPVGAIHSGDDTDASDTFLYKMNL